MAAKDAPLHSSTSTFAGGVSLEQFAGVTAALAERFALPAILEQEQIAEDVWPEAKRAWTQRIVGSPDLQLELLDKHRIAEDCLGPTLDPLDDDPEAWVGVMGALATGEDRAALIEALGITMADVARLGRRWKRKMKEDPALAKRVGELSAKAKPPASVIVGPRQLRRFPWSPPPRFAPAEIHVEVAPSSPLDLGAAIAHVQRASFQLQESTLAPAPAIEPTRLPPADTPFEPLEPEAHGLSLLKYTELVATLEQPHADVTAALEAHGLDEAKHGSVDAFYKTKLAREPRWASEFALMLDKARQDVAARRAIAEGTAPILTTGTEDIDVAAYLREAGLPFPSMNKAAVAMTKDLPATAYLDEAPTPFKASATVPELNPEQYAWVLTTLRRTPPERMGAALDLLRLTPETRRSLEENWNARMAKDPALAERVAAALARFMYPPT